VSESIVIIFIFITITNISSSSSNNNITFDASQSNYIVQYYIVPCIPNEIPLYPPSLINMARSDTDTWTDTWQEHWSDDSGRDDSGRDDGGDDCHDEYSAEYNDSFHAQGAAPASYHPQQFVRREDDLAGGGNGSGSSSSRRRQHPLDMRPPSGRQVEPQQSRPNGTDDSVSSESSGEGMGDLQDRGRGQRRLLLGRQSRRPSQQQQQKQQQPWQQPQQRQDPQQHSFDVYHPHPPEKDHGTWNDLRGYRRHRADAWLYLLVTSGVAVGSLVRARRSDAIPSFVVTESGAYVTGVALTSVTLAAAAVMAVGYRLPWFRRNALRQGMRRQRRGASGVGVVVSPEMAVAMVAFALHLAAMSVILDGSNYLATRGTMIANSNLFYATWTSFGLLVFLVSNLLSTTCSHDDYNNYRNGNPSRAYLTTLWLSHLHLSAATLATSLALRYRTPLCRGLLSSSPVCDSPLATLVSSSLSLGLTLLALLVARSETRRSLPPSRARRIQAVLAGTASMLDAIGTIYVTSPGGMGFVSGNLFWVSWAGTGAALALWVGYLNGACAAPTGTTGSFSFPAKDAANATTMATTTTTHVHLSRIRAPGSDSSRATEPTDTEDESSNEGGRLPRRSRQYQYQSNSNSNSHPALPEGVLPPPPNMMASENIRGGAANAAPCSSSSSPPPPTAAPDARGLRGHLFGAGASVRASDRLPSPSDDDDRPDAEGSTARGQNRYCHPYDPAATTGESRSARDPDAGSAFSSDPTPPPPPAEPRGEDETETESDSERRSSRRRRTRPSPVGNASASEAETRSRSTRSRSTRSSSTNSNSRTKSKRTKKKKKDQTRGGDQPQSVFNLQQQQQYQQQYQQQPQYPPPLAHPPQPHPPQPQSQQPFPYHPPVTGSFTTYQGHGQSSYVSFPSFNSAPVNPPADSVSSRSDGIVGGVGTSTESSSGRTPRTVDESERDDDPEEKSSLSTPRTETDRSGPMHAQHDRRSASKSPGRPSVTPTHTTANTTKSRKSSSRSRSSSRGGASGAGERRSVTPSKSTASSSKASSRSPGNYRANTNRYGNDNPHPRHPYPQPQSQLQNPYPHNLPPPPPPSNTHTTNPLYPLPSVTTINPSDSDTAISDPTIDHSIMTSKQKGVEREKQVNHAVAAALAHAEAFKKTTAAASKKSSSKSGSGSGNKNGSKNGAAMTTVDEVVAAAIAAATFKTGGGMTAMTMNGSSGGGGKRRNRGSGSGSGGASPAMFQHPYVVPPPVKRPPVDDTSAENAERSSIHSFYSQSKHSKGSGSNHSLSTNSAFDC